LNFDDRRAAGNKVLLFSCGGRADGDGQTTDSQLFQFSGAVTTGTRTLSPKNANNQQCFVQKGNVLDVAGCNNSADQVSGLVYFGRVGVDVG
jgi:hypothetical protein